MVDVEHAWHYTTSAGLIGMLTTHRLWATSAAYMNDSEEIRAGRDALRKAIEEHDPQLEGWQIEQLRELGITSPGNPHNLFLLCASTDGDALTLWRSYGADTEAEYAIDFDPSVDLLPVVQRSGSHPEPVPMGWYDDVEVEMDEWGRPMGVNDPDSTVAWGGSWGRVSYLDSTSRDADDELKRLLRHVRPRPEGSNTLPFLIDYLGGPDPTVNFKHPGFQDEREVRASWWVTPWWRFALYRAGRFGITPYIEVGVPRRVASFGDAIEDEAEIGRLPIRTVRIGPTRNDDYAEKSLRQLLDVSGYANVQIERSSTPYR